MVQTKLFSDLFLVNKEKLIAIIACRVIAAIQNAQKSGSHAQPVGGPGHLAFANKKRKTVLSVHRIF